MWPSDDSMLTIAWQPQIRITVRDLAGHVIDVVERSNLIVTVGFSMLRDCLQGVVADAEIKYVAVGSDSTAPALADTVLGTETFRKAVTSFSNPSATSLKTIMYIAPAEAVGAIAEIGWFAGAAAGAGADTGILVGRVLYSRVKTALESIQVERTDTFSEVA